MARLLAFILAVVMAGCLLYIGWPALALAAYIAIIGFGIYIVKELFDFAIYGAKH